MWPHQHGSQGRRLGRQHTGLECIASFRRGVRATALVGIDFRALLQELLRLLGHAAPGILADLLRNLHRAEFRAAHRAEMRELGAVRRQGLVVELLRGFRVERQVELVAPAELEEIGRAHV